MRGLSLFNIEDHTAERSYPGAGADHDEVVIQNPGQDKSTLGPLKPEFRTQIDFIEKIGTADALVKMYDAEFNLIVVLR